jgi:hypothetical protein
MGMLHPDILRARADELAHYIHKQPAFDPLESRIARLTAGLNDAEMDRLVRMVSARLKVLRKNNGWRGRLWPVGKDSDEDEA